jgi:hypothetical protein
MPARPGGTTASSNPWQALAALGGFFVAAFLMIGLPMLLEPGSQYAGQRPDPLIFIWSLAWWPHAIAHGLNPFVTHAVWAPDGVNLTWVTSAPGLALLFAPVTILLGPVAAFNAAAVSMPALGSWFAYLLCRYLTGDLWASVAGGSIFGFSCFLFGHAGGGQLHLSGAGVLVPLIALVVLKFLDGRLTRGKLVVLLGPLLALTLLISTEVALMLAVGFVVSLVLGYGLVRERREAIRTLLPGLVAAGVLAALLASPFLYYLLAGFRSTSYFDPDAFEADLLNFVLPAGTVLFGGHWGSALVSWGGSFSETYIGIPALVIVVLFAWRGWRTPSARFLLVAFAIAAIAAMGAYATIAGDRVVDFPWVLFHRLPAFDNILPSRFAVFLSLLAAVIVALWAASANGALRWLLPTLAVLAILPNLATGSLWKTTYAVQPFFTTAAYKRCLDPGETILPLPIGQGEAMLWQAKSGFWFDLAGGYLGPYIPPSFLTPPGNYTISVGNHLGPDEAAAVRSFIEQKHITSVVVDADEAPFFTPALAGLAAPKTVGGVLVYQLSRLPPSCTGS